VSLDLTDWVLIALVMGALGPYVALGGHGAIAWTAVKRFFANAVGHIDRRVDEVEKKLAALEERLSSLKPEVPDVKAAALAAITEFYQSPASSAIVDAIAARVKPAVKESIGGYQGNLLKVNVQRIEGAMNQARFDDPLKQMAWGMIPADLKHDAAVSLVRILAQGQVAVVDEESSGGGTDAGLSEWVKANGG
jgi:phage-related protein